jgi:NAD(P)-dependent dehydrogenase (short-subunit alcohol dehydrogenase family)
MAAAKALSESGLEVVVTGRDEAKLEVARQTLGSQGRAERIGATSEEEVRAFFERTGLFAGPVEVRSKAASPLPTGGGEALEIPRSVSAIVGGASPAGATGINTTGPASHSMKLPLQVAQGLAVDLQLKVFSVLLHTFTLPSKVPSHHPWSTQRLEN